CKRLNPRLVQELERLGTMLERALVGRRISVSWTHGEYTPGNVRMAGMQGPVNSIVGWGGAQGDRPALIDEYLMILTTSWRVQRSNLGAAGGERLRAGGLSDSERNAMRVAYERTEADFGA